MKKHIVTIHREPRQRRGDARCHLYAVTIDEKETTLELPEWPGRDRYLDALMSILYRERYFDFTGTAVVSSQGETRHYECLADGRVLRDYQ